MNHQKCDARPCRQGSNWEPVEAEKEIGVYYCSICHKNIVDAENGYDTCDTCLTNM